MADKKLNCGTSQIDKNYYCLLMQRNINNQIKNNMKHMTKFLLFFCMFGYITFAQAQEVVKDYDGNVYKTVKIGSQVWMAQNLKTTHFQNGDPIPNVTDGMQWKDLIIGAYGSYDNIRANADIYGHLYNWYAVNDSRNIAPSGWHIPTDAEWTTLTTYLGGKDIAGSKLKETGTTYWLTPNAGATNESGFTALPGGYREIDGKFGDVGFKGFWWSSTELYTVLAWYRNVGYDYINVFRVGSNKSLGLSVRCVRNI